MVLSLKRMKMKNFNRIILSVIIIAFAFLSCNPVRQVLKDKEKFDQVANEVIKRGYCLIDTLVVNTSDTILVVDTLYDEIIKIDTMVKNDTVYFWQNKIFNVRSKYIIKDTIKLIDSSRINVLNAELKKKDEHLVRYYEMNNQLKRFLIYVSAALVLLIVIKIRG